MGGEEGRPILPNVPPTGERKGNSLAGGAVMSPLAANLVGFMEQARQTRERQGFREFYPQWWMYTALSEGAGGFSPNWRNRVTSEEGKKRLQKEGININSINTREEISDEGLQEREQFFRDIATAYGIAAYAQLTPRQKGQLRKELREEIAVSNADTITLNEHQRQVLSQIASATETPLNPQQETYQYSTILQQPDITAEEMEKNPGYSTW
ncbi:MAG TPA: hypothetical protein VFV38_14700 [Ktedonobacteraceae bacterium]|nr:hypothetical protein [Ktedonobacteraceae bacterium]